MKQVNYRGGRHKKADPSTAFRCSVNFTASEQARLLEMQEKNGIASLSAFIKMHLSDFNNQYRRIVNDYDLLVQTLKENFTEKKALKCLYALEQETIKLVKLNREIVALAKDFDEQWLQKSQ